MGKRYGHTLKLIFGGRMQLPQYSGVIYAPSVRRPDMVKITRSTIEFSFERSSKLKCVDVLSNKTRADQIKRAMLFINACAQTVPKLKAIEYFDGAEHSYLAPSSAMRGWYFGASNHDEAHPPVDPKVAERVFANGPADKAIARSLSFICASRRIGGYVSQYDRFRCLWSGFNAIYAYIGDKRGLRKENKCIDSARQYLEDNCDAGKLLETYMAVDSSAIMNQLNYYSFLKSRLLNRYHKLNDDWADALGHMDFALLTKSQSIVFKILDEHGGDKAKAEAQIARADESEMKQALFLAFDYAYGLRNSFFHGEAQYPLFETERDEVLELVSDLLEDACLVILDKLSRDA